MITGSIPWASIEIGSDRTPISGPLGKSKDGIEPAIATKATTLAVTTSRLISPGGHDLLGAGADAAPCAGPSTTAAPQSLHVVAVSRYSAATPCLRRNGHAGFGQ